MTSWEYCCLDESFEGKDFDPSIFQWRDGEEQNVVTFFLIAPIPRSDLYSFRSLAEGIAILGSDGWEMCGVTATEDKDARFIRHYFKRPLPD